MFQLNVSLVTPYVRYTDVGLNWWHIITLLSLSSILLLFVLLVSSSRNIRSSASNDGKGGSYSEIVLVIVEALLKWKKSAMKHIE